MARIFTVTLNPAIDQTLAIPHFSPGRVNRAVAETVHAGGKGVNVAAVLAGLGATVAATGVLGAANCEPFETLFHERQIEDHFVRTAGRTRVGIKIVDPVTTQTTDINFAGLAVDADTLAEVNHRLLTLIEPKGWVVVAGSVPTGVPLTVYADWIDAIHERGGRVALDTSGEALAIALHRKPDFAKPNAEELSQILGRPLETLEACAAAARELVDRFGVQCAALSMGGDGAIFANAAATIHARPPTVAVRSTVGAGDSMVAGAVLALSQGESLEQIARRATALGADAVTRVGVGIDAARSFEALQTLVTLAAVD